MSWCDNSCNCQGYMFVNNTNYLTSWRAICVHKEWKRDGMFAALAICMCQNVFGFEMGDILITKDNKAKLADFGVS